MNIYGHPMSITTQTTSSEPLSPHTAQASWGRASEVSKFTSIGTVCILAGTPLLVLYFYISAFAYNCSLLAPLIALWEGKLSLKLPSLTRDGIVLLIAWISLQIGLALAPDFVHKFLPGYRGGMRKGAITPAGNQLSYNINGLQAWLLSHFLFFSGSFVFGLFSPAIIFDNWGPLLIASNLVGYLLAFYVYIKAHYWPSYAEDRKFSGNPFYDFYMGIELNPRVGLIDLKLFFNGRPGIVAWTMINLSFAFAQYQRYGTVTNAMILVNLLHALYVLYFFWKEEWYLNTIDIHHDHFGWMLAWGDSVWLPFMYTLQGLYLVINPVTLTTPYALFVLALGLFGFWIFVSANGQKDRFRKNDGRIFIQGKPAQYIPCEYFATDGTRRSSKLLTSGWWGIARHMNYTGDLLLSLAYCLACGTTHLFPYFYFIFISMLLIHRCLRDEDRCQRKYGSSWVQYCSQTRFRLLPYIW